MSVNVDFHAHEGFAASTKSFGEFITFEVQGEGGNATFYIKNVEDAQRIYKAAFDAVVKSMELFEKSKVA